jgi:hypothetical protein
MNFLNPLNFLEFENIISMLSLGVACFALFKTKKTERRMLSIEETREHDRIQLNLSAKLIANVKENKNNRRVVISNHGNANAKGIKVKFDDVPFQEHKLVPKGISDIGDIGPGSQTSIMIAPTMGNCNDFTVHITWQDDSNEEGVFTSTLSPT